MTGTTLVIGPLAKIAVMIATPVAAIGDESDGKTSHQATLQTAATNVARDPEIEMSAHTTREDSDHPQQSESVAPVHR